MNVVKIGLDEAGRGCVLGGLYVAAVAIDSDSTEEFLRNKGVRDSKKISKDKREELYVSIYKHTHSELQIVTPQQIDSGNLNDLELKVMAKLINNIIGRYENACFDENIYEIYIDCPISDNEKHKKQISKLITHKDNIRIITENKADDKYIVVGAASIVAKTLRDESIEFMSSAYRDEYGDIGSGYPSDSRTVNFLKKYYENEFEFPRETRTKWGTIERIRSDFNEVNKI